MLYQSAMGSAKMEMYLREILEYYAFQTFFEFAVGGCNSILPQWWW